MATRGRLDVIAPGTPVVFGDGVRGYVSAITIRGEASAPHVSYEVVWFVEADRHEAWVAAWEVRPDEATPALRIGFA